MDMQSFFTKELFDIYDVDGNLKANEPIHLTRQGISNNDFSHTHKFKGLCKQQTEIAEGDLVVDQDVYIVTALRNIPFLNTTQCTLLKCTDTCNVYRLEDRFIGSQSVGTQEVEVKVNIPCVQKDTNGQMKYFDAGLLESTIKIVYMQYSKDIKLMDRLKINEQYYKIDSISNSIKNVMIVQLSADKR